MGSTIPASPTPSGQEEGGFRLNIANSEWGQEGYNFHSEFLDTLAVNYGGEVRRVDFRSDPEDATVLINDWVADETEGRIQDLVPQGAIDELTRLVLANAIYLKASWHWQFREEATRCGQLGEQPIDLRRVTEVDRNGGLVEPAQPGVHRPRIRR